MDEQTAVDLADGRLTWRTGTLVMPHKINAAERQEYEAAKTRGYIVRRGSRINLHNAWWVLCEAWK